MQQAANTATTLINAGGTIAEIYLILKLAHEYIQEKCKAYDETSSKEIRAIQDAYLLHCYPVEKDNSPSVLTLFSEFNQNGKKELPLFFQMDGKIPSLFNAGLGMAKLDHPWKRFLKPTSGLMHFIEEMLKKINIYKQQRGERFFSLTRGFEYDPINLLFEEFQWFLRELSSAEPNEITLKIVKGKIEYFNDLINKKVFTPGESSPTRIETLIYLRDVLQWCIEPLLQGARHKEGAREHFLSLQHQTTRLIKSSMSFLFYVFRDDSDLPNSLPIDSLRVPDKLFAKAVSSISGKFLKKLALTEACLNACPPLSVEKKEKRYADLAFLCENIFLDEKGQPLFPLTKEDEREEGREVSFGNINTWFQKENPGILIYFRKAPLMQKFLKIHGLVLEVCLFSIICEILYELAGLKGDFGVYGEAASKVMNAVVRYQKYIDDLHEEIKACYDSATQLQRIYYQEDKQEKNKIQNFDGVKKWTNNFEAIGQSFRDFQEAHENSKKLITQVNDKIISLKSEHYVRRFNLLLNTFNTIVDRFVDRKNITNSNTNLSENPFSLFARNPEIDQRSQIVFDEKIESERDELLGQIQDLEKKAKEIEKHSEEEKQDLKKQVEELTPQIKQLDEDFKKFRDHQDSQFLKLKEDAEKKEELFEKEKQDLEKNKEDLEKQIEDLQSQIQDYKEISETFFQKHQTAVVSSLCAASVILYKLLESFAVPVLRNSLSKG